MWHTAVVLEEAALARVDEIAHFVHSDELFHLPLLATLLQPIVSIRTRSSLRSCSRLTREGLPDHFVLVCLVRLRLALVRRL